MIYEMITYDLKARAQKEFEERFGEAYEHRKKFSEIAAFWHTEIGLIDQVFALWSYKDLDDRAKVKKAASESRKWPPNVSEFVNKTHSDILIPFSCSPEIKPCDVGPYFEMRSYSYIGGGLQALMKVWNESVPWRLKYGPVVGLFYTEIGALNKFTHIWPYRSLNDRIEIREKAKAHGKWPPHRKSLVDGDGGYELIARENRILMPASFSPVQ